MSSSQPRVPRCLAWESVLKIRYCCQTNPDYTPWKREAHVLDASWARNIPQTPSCPFLGLNPWLAASSRRSNQNLCSYYSSILYYGNWKRRTSVLPKCLCEAVFFNNNWWKLLIRIFWTSFCIVLSNMEVLLLPRINKNLYQCTMIYPQRTLNIIVLFGIILVASNGNLS